MNDFCNSCMRSPVVDWNNFEAKHLNTSSYTGIHLIPVSVQIGYWIKITFNCQKVCKKNSPTILWWNCCVSTVRNVSFFQKLKIYPSIRNTSSLFVYHVNWLLSRHWYRIWSDEVWRMVIVRAFNKMLQLYCIFHVKNKVHRPCLS